MARQFISKSVLDAYTSPRKTHWHPMVLCLAGIVVLVLVCVFSSSDSTQVVQPSGHASSPAVEVGLSKNLSWLSHQGVDNQFTGHKKAPIKARLGESKELRPASPKIEVSRLKASSVVFHQAFPSQQRSKTGEVTPAIIGDRIVAGEVLHAVLESAIQSDLAGPVRAMLSEPVYAYDSTQLLLPVGTRIIGRYQNKVTATQERLGICWQRMILPDGRSVNIDAPAVDPVGRLGVRATEINRHFWKRFGEAALYSLLSAGAQASGGLDAETLTAGQLLRAEVSDSFANTAMSMLEENKQTTVTLSLDPGSDISIFVRHDIVF